MDSSKYLDHSFERLVRNSRAKSPFHREQASCYRESYPSVRDTYRHKSRDHLPIIDTSYSSKNRESLRPPMLSYRSKSYHGDLSRIARPIATSSYFDGVRKDEMYRSHRSLSRSASNLNSSNSYNNLRNFTPSYVNTYSRHHSHHSHQMSDTPKTPVQMNWRSRFHSRNAYKAYRSRSANRPNERDYSISMPRTIRSSTPGGYRTDSVISDYPSYDSLTINSRASKSFSDIRTIQSRIDHDLLHLPLRREKSYSSRFIDRHTDHELASHILNPDIYVRWLKNKWDIEESMRRQHHSVVSTHSHTDDYVHTPKNRPFGCSYPSRMKCLSYDSLRHSFQIPTFSKTIKGKGFSLFPSILFDFFFSYTFRQQTAHFSQIIPIIIIFMNFSFPQD